MEWNIEPVNRYNSFVVDGVVFEFDRENMLIAERDNLGNISIIKDEYGSGDNMHLQYDRDSRTFQELKTKGPFGVEYYVFLPWEFITNHATPYDYLNERSFSGKWNCAFFGDLYDKRVAGGDLFSPTIPIMGYSIKVNGFTQMLGFGLNREYLGVQSLIALDNGRSGYGLYYDCANLRAINPGDVDVESRSSNNTVYLQIPPLKAIDPVGVAIREGKPAWAYLNTYRMQSAYKVPILPLSQSPLKSIQAKPRKRKKNGI